MPVASWIAIGIAAFIPVATVIRNRRGKSGRGMAAALTSAAAVTGLIGIVN